MEFRIDAAARQPIYRQIVEQVREAVARGRIAREERLPSVRELSRMLVVNPNTVARAYSELEREGILNTRQGLGVFVAAPKMELTKKARKERLFEILDRLLTEAVCLGFTADEVAAAVEERVKRFQWVPTESAS
ncbi:MAG TPA: GntR family transcriptional regulator [Planctomycetaceae bacterium]|jgi:GntR family transcriptional regulator|nr:GntR family transcriptional regulator [Planctomycetaceae bacterium]